jgi:hypothetical protein
MMLEDILLALGVGIVLLAVGLPIFRFLKVATWRRRDPLAEAHERLRLAKLEAEAEKINREADRIREQLYEQALTDDRRSVDARVAEDEGAGRALDQPPEKGKRHGQS